MRDLWALTTWPDLAFGTGLFGGIYVLMIGGLS